MQHAHYFIALSLPPFIKNTLCGWQEMLRVSLPYRQSTHPDDLHITLKFLGEVDDSKLVKLHRLLKTELSSVPFFVRISSIGFFGESSRPTILWAGVDVASSLVFLTIKESIPHTLR